MVLVMKKAGKKSKTFTIQQRFNDIQHESHCVFIERTLAWSSRNRRLVRDCKRYAQLAGRGLAAVLLP